MTGDDGEQRDGRRARRERSRAAVIDAVFAVVGAGKIPPTVEMVAEQAGVSVSSIFRNFDGLDDVQRQAFDEFQRRFESLLQPRCAGDAEREARVAAHVGARVELFEQAGPMLRIARQRALDYEPMAAGVARNRMALADQTSAHFAAEVRELTPANGADLIAALDALTSPEAYEVMSAAHGRTSRQINRAWKRSIDALLAGWPELTNVHVVPGTT